MRKYIYGARVDEPVCMLDVADSNAAYYYHFDGLGSVVALSNSNGDSCQSYEYSAYGQVAASDPEFLSNPYMFTGRRFDIETGLYYYRARYYNPHIGRFMQTDPVGYGAGMNWYLYCRNNPLAFVDPSGCVLQVTGPYITLPGHNNYPGKSMAANIVSQVAKLAINVIELTGLDDKDPRVKIIKEYYLESLEKAAEEVSKLERTDVWRTFIEVYDSNDPNDKYWIEVCGFRMPSRTGESWDEELGGYVTWGDAADAGGSLVHYAQQNGGFIPNNVPAGWHSPSWGNVSPYITNKPYKFDEEFLNLLKNVNAFLELKEKLEEEWND